MHVELWEWNYVLNLWDKVPSCVITITALGVGVIVNRPCRLYWIACSPDAAGSEFQLADALALPSPEVYCHFDDDRHSEHLHISPPMLFEVGIYVSKFDKIKCLHFGYV